MTKFRVFCENNRDYIACAMAFTAAGESEVDSWNEKAVNHMIPKFNLSSQRFLGQAGGSWYFSTSTVDWDLHNSRWKHNFHVNDGCDGKPRVVSLFWTIP